MRIFSFNKSIIKDNKFSIFKLDEFDYQIDKEFLKGKNVTIIENSNLSENEISKYYFENGFFDLKNNRFKTGETKITLKKIFLIDLIMTQGCMEFHQTMRVV